MDLLGNRGSGRQPADPHRVVRLRHLVARGFRNLADLDCELPASGLVLLGANAQGKTNLLEAIYYPVLFRSFRGAPDQEVARSGGRAFMSRRGRGRTPAAVGRRDLSAAGRRKRIVVDEASRSGWPMRSGTGWRWSFLPDDVGLASGPAAERRRTSTGCSRWPTAATCGALWRYRAALAQRNSALRQGRSELARAFDRAAGRGRARRGAGRAAVGVGRGRERFAAELECLGEGAGTRLRIAAVTSWPSRPRGTRRWRRRGLRPGPRA